MYIVKFYHDVKTGRDYLDPARTARKEEKTGTHKRGNRITYSYLFPSMDTATTFRRDLINWRLHPDKYPPPVATATVLKVQPSFNLR